MGASENPKGNLADDPLYRAEPLGRSTDGRSAADHDALLYGRSFSDCTSFVLMRELNLREALTTHCHFLQAGIGIKDALADLVDSKEQHAFGAAKETALPRCCHQCDVLFACRDGCLKQRFLKSPNGEPGLNYLGPGFKNFLHHVNLRVNRMVQFIRA